MKKLLVISISILLVNIGIAQENSDWVDSILTKVILNEIEVFDPNFKLLKNDKIKLSTRDTVVNCEWSRPKYVNNILQGSFDGVLIDRQIEFDTSTNQRNRKYIDFKSSQFDALGNHLNDSIIFIIKREASRIPIQNLNSKLIGKLKNTTWINQRIFVEDKKIKLDSCHEIFKLTFNEDFTFIQQYGNNQNSCHTKNMDRKIEVGLEGDSKEFIKYHDKLQGHFLDIKKGRWKVIESQILLIDLNGKRTLSLKIEKLNKKKLHINFIETNYKLKMKKTRR